MDIKPTKRGCKAFKILQILSAANGSSVCVKDLAQQAGTLATSTTISQLRAKGWMISNTKILYQCPTSGKRELSSRYTLLSESQLEFPFGS